jgi:hypothetical protein
MIDEEAKKTIWANRTGESYSEALKTIAALIIDHGETVADDYLITVGFEKAPDSTLHQRGFHLLSCQVTQSFPCQVFPHRNINVFHNQPGK